MSRRQSVYPASILKSILDKRRKQGSIPAPLKWGIDNEAVAVTEYKKRCVNGSFDVKDCGLVVNPSWP